MYHKRTMTAPEGCEVAATEEGSRKGSSAGICKRARRPTMSSFTTQNLSHGYDARKFVARPFTSTTHGGRGLMRKQPLLHKKRTTQLSVRAEKVVGIDLGTTNSAVSIFLALFVYSPSLLERLDSTMAPRL